MKKYCYLTARPSLSWRRRLKSWPCSLHLVPAHPCADWWKCVPYSLLSQWCPVFPAKAQLGFGPKEACLATLFHFLSSYFGFLVICSFSRKQYFIVSSSGANIHCLCSSYHGPLWGLIGPLGHSLYLSFTWLFTVNYLSPLPTVKVYTVKIPNIL